MLSEGAQAYRKHHLKFLRENNPDLLHDLQKKGDLRLYLDRVGTQADERYQTLIAQGSTDPNLPKDYAQRVQALQSLPLTADEIVMSEIVNQPLPSRG